MNTINTFSNTTTITNTSTTSLPKPNNNRGRKKLTTEPKSKRTGQNRSAQEAFRQRKAAYVSSLEDRVRILEAENKRFLVKLNHGGLFCASCQQQLQQQQQQFHQLAPAAVYSTIDPFLFDLGHLDDDAISFPDDWMELLGTTTASSSDGSRPGAVKSVEQVCGKVEVESARIAFNTLNSINNKKRDEATTTTLADLLLDEIVKQSKCTDAQQVLEYQTRISRIGHCLLDSCDLMDRQKCIEICAVFFERNKAHLKYISDITSSIVLNRVNAFPWQSSSSATSTVQQTVLLPPDAIRFRNAMKSIPSLSNLHSLIDEFCILFWNDDELDSLEDCFDDAIQRVDNFNTKGNHHHPCQETTLIYLTQLHHTFDSTITGTRDLEKWLTAFEIAKISNRARVSQLMR